MPRQRLKRIHALALSPAMPADALGVRPETINAMIRNGLPCFKIGTRRRVFVRDAVRMAKRTWKPWR